MIGGGAALAFLGVTAGQSLLGPALGVAGIAPVLGGLGLAGINTTLTSPSYCHLSRSCRDGPDEPL